MFILIFLNFILVSNALTYGEQKGIYQELISSNHQLLLKGLNRGQIVGQKNDFNFQELYSSKNGFLWISDGGQSNFSWDLMPINSSCFPKFKPMEIIRVESNDHTLAIELKNNRLLLINLLNEKCESKEFQNVSQFWVSKQEILIKKEQLSIISQNFSSKNLSIDPKELRSVLQLSQSFLILKNSGQLINLNTGEQYFDIDQVSVFGNHYAILSKRKSVIILGENLIFHSQNSMPAQKLEKLPLSFQNIHFFEDMALISGEKIGIVFSEISNFMPIPLPKKIEEFIKKSEIVKAHKVGSRVALMAKNGTLLIFSIHDNNSIYEFKNVLNILSSAMGFLIEEKNHEFSFYSRYSGYQKLNIKEKIKQVAVDSFSIAILLTSGKVILIQE